ncbi:MAG: DUF4270 domain-containing protein [Muribaculaceae bacterium]|nr:DUF4270 domain-containing protein [Muribaculaceae bacterium]
MKSTLPFLSGAILLLGSLFTACENTTQDIGSSLIQAESEVVIHNEFSVSGHSTPNTAIESRTIVQLLGDISAEGYGNFSADFVCQFMPASKLVTDGVTVNDLDSMKLILAYPNGGYVGDSIAPMGLEVFPLNRQLTSPIFSTFNPEEYCDVTAAPLASKIYVGNAQGENDSIQALSYREIYVDLPLSLARDLFTLYVENPEAYSFPSEFAKHFPGIYVRNSFGAGRVTQIQQTSMVIYYHTTSEDAEGNEVKTSHEGNYFVVSPEVISNNNISFTIDPALQARIDAGESIIVAPVGRDVEITFPIRDVLDYYLDNCGPLSVVNTLTMTIPAEEIENAYGIGIPESLLMVVSSEKDEFFLNNSLNDDKKSFIATYSASSKGYVFSGLRNYFLAMLDKYNADGTIDIADATFTLTPVTLTTESTSNGYTTSTYVSAITPYIGKPAMGKLNLDKADITFQFSKQSFK